MTHFDEKRLSVILPENYKQDINFPWISQTL